MLIGVPKEVKEQEDRVAITPAGVDAFVRAGHKVYIETQAGVGSGFSDLDFEREGAKILKTARDIYNIAELIIKVKEPILMELDLMREHQIVFTYLHLAPNPALTRALLEKKVIGIAYETVQQDNGMLPLLYPTSEVAGRMAVQVGAHLLEKTQGGRGMLLCGMPGVEPARVAVIGGGTVGANAIKMAIGMGAQVTVLDINIPRLAYLDDLFGGRIVTLMSNPFNIARVVEQADLVIGAVLIPGGKAPKLVTEEMVWGMRPGTVIMDVAIDQGGIVETIDHTTTHENPTFVRHGVTHYAVANMPGAVPRTSTFALTNATLPYALRIAELGAEKAMSGDCALRRGLNVYQGSLTNRLVAEEQGLRYTPDADLF
ncbi:MAG: alanine dehydrogenase [Oscillospiraceae bacterium]|nr:alanine dehydrogenase [Oscillospiraceae bacterium]